MPFFLQNSFLAILMLTSRKPVKRRRTDEKMSFFFLLLAGRSHKRVKESYQLNWPLSTQNSQICQIQQETGLQREKEAIAMFIVIKALNS